MLWAQFLLKTTSTDKCHSLSVPHETFWSPNLNLKAKSWINPLNNEVFVATANADQSMLMMKPKLTAQYLNYVFLECTSLKSVQASEVLLPVAFISRWCNWKKSMTMSLKCFQTKPIKCKSYGNVPHLQCELPQTTRPLLYDPLSPFEFCSCMDSHCLGAFLETDMIHIQTVFFLPSCPEVFWVQKWLMHLFSFVYLFYQHHSLMHLKSSSWTVFDILYCNMCTQS